MENKSAERKLKQIAVEIWGGQEFYYEPEEIRSAQTDGEVLECLKDRRGVPPYSSVRCAILAETPDGRKLVRELRRQYEGERDKRKDKKEMRKRSVAEN